MQVSSYRDDIVENAEAVTQPKFAPIPSSFPRDLLALSACRLIVYQTVERDGYAGFRWTNEL